MDDSLVTRVTAHPKYQELKSKRSRFAWGMTLAGMAAYYGFILLVAFDKPLLAQKIGGGVTSLGMPLGVAVIVFTIIITWIYIRRANSEFDSLNEQIVKGVVK
jgi:uncharacterized membrane protein (DUF485 family)